MPSEAISPDLTNKYQEYYNQIVELIKEAKKEKITIGSDPEFFLSSPYTGELVDASNVISDDRNNQPLGLDGHNFTAELRPQPSTNPLTHAKNIEKILSNYLNKNKDLTSFDFYPSASNEYAGGHIGIGHSYAKSFNFSTFTIPLAFINPNSLPKQSEVSPPTQLAIIRHIFIPILKQAREQRYLVSDGVLDKLGVSEQLKAKTRNINSNLIKALDLAIGFPLAYIEIPKHAITRKQHYGQLSQYRNQSYGVEYRTPPSWLATKKLTQATLSLAYCVAHDIYHKETPPPPL
jgi:hypothetical protein